MTYYRQCELQKETTFEVAWVPEHLAVQGKYVRFGEDNGWEVRSAGKLRISEDYVLERERDHLHQRRASDI